MPQEVTFKVDHKPDGTATARITAYALALMATREREGRLEVVQEAAWTSAQSDREAHDFGMKIAMEKWPSGEGWRHQAAIRRVNMVIDLLKKEQ